MSLGFGSFPVQVKSLVVISVATTVVLLSVMSYSRPKWLKTPVNTKRLRAKLPKNLASWRIPGEDIDDAGSEAIWKTLDPLLRQHELEQWEYGGCSILSSPGGSLRMPNGYVHVAPSRALADDASDVGTALDLTGTQYMNATFRIARMKNGHDVTVRPIRLGAEGVEHLKILKKIATGPLALLSNNHALPMFDTINFEDVTLGLFPLTANDMGRAFGFWPKNSVGDVVDMILQALEGLAFLHEHKIAHRDADRSNFVVDYHPESLRTMTVATSRPRVHIIDFEVSVMFPEDLPLEDCVCVGVPVGGSIGDKWRRPAPPEVSSGQPYSAFKQDVWQFGYCFTGSYTYRTTIPAIDNILISLVDDPVQRPSAMEALNMLRSVIGKIPPNDMLIPPYVIIPGQEE